MPRKAKSRFDPASTEPFPLSRTKLSDFLACPRCFYLDRRLGIAKPSMPSFSLNSAVDALLKREFDVYRQRQEPHPLMTENGVTAVPFAHADLGTWRSNFKGIRHCHAPSNFIAYGAIDDVWQEPGGALIIVDYKATSTRQPITLDTEYRQGYKRQVELYQWLFRKNGFAVSRRAYVLYANARTDRDGFNGRLEFDVMLIAHDGDDSWVGDALVKARDCLMGTLPDPSPECEWCGYRQASMTPPTVA